MNIARSMLLVVALALTLPLAYGDSAEDKKESNLKWWLRKPSTKSAQAADAPVKTRDVETLRKQQQRAVDDLQKVYDKKARDVAGKPDGTVDKSSPEYQKLQKEHRQRKQQIEERFSDLDSGRGKELDRVSKKYKGKIKNSGGRPKNVKSDLDFTASSDDAAKALAEEWKASGDDVVYDKKTGKYRNKTKDATLWEPATPDRQAARAADPDAFVKPGGKHAAGVRGPEAVADPRGYHSDNKKKYAAAKKSGDLRTQGKSLSKSAKATGHKSKITQQADIIRQGGSTDDAGITDLGDSPEVKKQKIEKWQQNADAEMSAMDTKAKAKSDLKQKVRRKLAKQVRKNTPAHDDWKTADAIEGRADQVEQSHKDTPEQAAKKTKKIDGPDGDGYVGGKPAKKKPGYFSPKGKIGQVMEGAGKIDTAVLVVGTGTKVVKGIQKGDAEEVAEAGLGKDTVDRHRQGRKLEDDATKMDDATKSVVRSELKAKLRRKGATEAEAEAAMESRDKGDREGWDRVVREVKSRNIVDTKQRALDPGKNLDMKDDWGSRLWEGTKQAGTYADLALGGIHATTKTMVKEKEALNKERGVTQDGVQQEVDSKVIAKMVREGIPVSEARRAVEERKAGDSTRFNELREQMHAKGTTLGPAGEGQDATGRTGSYEAKDYVEGMVDSAKQGFENRAATLQEPFNMWAEHGEKKNLENMREQELVAKHYKIMRQAGADKDEALEAARSYVEEGDNRGVRTIARRYQKERKARIEAKKAAAEKAAAEKADAEAEKNEVAGEFPDPDAVGRLKTTLGEKKEEEGFIPPGGRKALDMMWSGKEEDSTPEPVSEEVAEDPDHIPFVPPSGEDYVFEDPYAEVGKARNDVGEYTEFGSRMIAMKGASETSKNADFEQQRKRDSGGRSLSKSRKVHQDTSTADAFTGELSKGLNQGLQAAGKKTAEGMVDEIKRQLTEPKRKHDVAGEGGGPVQVASGGDGEGGGKGSSRGGGKGKKGSKGGGKKGGKGGGKSGEGGGYDSATCGECGYSMKFPLGSRPPSRCPSCGAGGDRAHVECSVCGHSWTVPAGSGPGKCSQCAASRVSSESVSNPDPEGRQSIPAGSEDTISGGTGDDTGGYETEE